MVWLIKRLKVLHLAKRDIAYIASTLSYDSIPKLAFELKAQEMDSKKAK